MLGVISAALNVNNEEAAQGVLELFLDLAENNPTFFRSKGRHEGGHDFSLITMIVLTGHIQIVVPAMLQISAHDNLEGGTFFFCFHLFLFF
jgi:hypothetical protein